MPAPSLPTEKVLQILELLENANQPAAMARYCFVSRVFLSAARKLLYKTLTVAADRHWTADRFEWKLGRTTSTGHLLRTLENAPDLASATKQIVYHGQNYTQDEATSESLAALLKVVAAASGVEELILCGLDVTAPSSTVLRRAIKSAHSLWNLLLFECPRISAEALNLNLEKVSVKRTGDASKSLKPITSELLGLAVIDSKIGGAIVFHLLQASTNSLVQLVADKWNHPLSLSRFKELDKLLLALAEIESSMRDEDSAAGAVTCARITLRSAIKPTTVTLENPQESFAEGDWIYEATEQDLLGAVPSSVTCLDLSRFHLSAEDVENLLKSKACPSLETLRLAIMPELPEPYDDDGSWTRRQASKNAIIQLCKEQDVNLSWHEHVPPPIDWAALAAQEQMRAEEDETDVFQFDPDDEAPDCWGPQDGW